jgi:plasmid stabilization system protein ParE
MKYTFHPEARVELNDSVDYYEDRQLGLGFEFLQEVNRTIQRIIEFPEAWTLVSKNARRCLMDRFPFAVIYQIRKNEIFIVAVTHLARKPGYWKSRS